MPRIEIYTKGWCPYCHAAKSLLARKGARFAELSVADADAMRVMIQRAHGRRTVPQIFIDDRHIGGYDDLAALERSGRLDALLTAPAG